MGNIFCSDCCKKQGYESIDDSIDDFKDGSNIFDESISFFYGLWLERKFIQNTAYEKRFLWVSEDDVDEFKYKGYGKHKGYTIHMSEYSEKRKRHKEANLMDLVRIDVRKPSKAAQAVDENFCLTINFKAGGGIDLKFENQTDRDLWHKKLKTILFYYNDLKKKSLSEAAELLAKIASEIEVQRNVKKK